MQKINVTRQFFQASGRHGDVFQKKISFQIRSMGVCVPNFRSVSFFVWPGGVTQINTYINKYTHIQVKLGISSTGCSPHVDFEKACLDMVQESVCTKCQVCIVFRVAKRRNTDTHAHRHTSIQVKIRISPPSARLPWILTRQSRIICEKST